jgi:hypothetical protein
VVRNADALDYWIKECVIARLDTPSLSSLLDGGNDGQLRQLLIERDAQQLRLDGLVDDYATNVLTKAQFSRARATAESELERLNAEILTLNRKRHVGVVPAGQTVRAAWEGAESDDWRRGLLQLLIKRVMVNPGITKPFIPGTRMRLDPSLIEIEWLV